VSKVSLVSLKPLPQRFLGRESWISRDTFFSKGVSGKSAAASPTLRVKGTFNGESGERGG